MAEESRDEKSGEGEPVVGASRRGLLESVGLAAGGLAAFPALAGPGARRARDHTLEYASEGATAIAG